MAKLIFKDPLGNELTEKQVFERYVGIMAKNSRYFDWIKSVNNNTNGEIVTQKRGKKYIYRMMKRPEDKESFNAPGTYFENLRTDRDVEKVIAVDNEYSTDPDVVFELRDGADFPEIVEVKSTILLKHANQQAIFIDRKIIKTLIDNKQNANDTLTATVADRLKPTKEEAEALFQEIIAEAEKEINRITEYEMYYSEKSIVNVAISPDIQRIILLSDSYRAWNQSGSQSGAVEGEFFNNKAYGFRIQKSPELDPQNQSYYNPDGYEVIIEIDSLGGDILGEVNHDKVPGRNALTANINSVYGFDVNRPSNPSGLIRVKAYKLGGAVVPPTASIENIVSTDPSAAAAADGEIDFDVTIANFVGAETAILVPAGGTSAISLSDGANVGLNFSPLDAGDYNIEVKDGTTVIATSTTITLTDPVLLKTQDSENKKDNEVKSGQVELKDVIKIAANAEDIIANKKYKSEELKNLKLRVLKSIAKVKEIEFSENIEKDELIKLIEGK